MTDTELLKRVERLERDNRRLKRAGLALLVILAALTTIYATRPVPEVIKAHEFDLVDSSGTTRGGMAFVGNLRVSPMIYLNDRHGKTRLNMGVFPFGPPIIALFDARGKTRADMAVDSSGKPSIGLNDAQGERRVALFVDSPGKPAILLSDAKGYGMVLGNTAPVTPRTGKTEQTSAASIVMFGNDKEHRVIWKAP